jgi:hypothetical protein
VTKRRAGFEREPSSSRSACKRLILVLLAETAVLQRWAGTTTVVRHCGGGFGDDTLWNVGIRVR